MSRGTWIPSSDCVIQGQAWAINTTTGNAWVSEQIAAFTQTAHTCESAGDNFVAQGRFREAIDKYREAIVARNSIMKDLPDPTDRNHPGAVVCLSEKIKTVEDSSSSSAAAVKQKINDMKQRQRADNKPACFLAGNRINMADGKKLPIEEVRPGMFVRQQNPKQPSETFEAVVEDVRTKSTTEYAKITTRSGKSITCTVDHPFYLPQQGMWATLDGQGAHRLQVGSSLLSSRGLDVLSKVEMKSDPQGKTVYSLTVSGHHCHFVEGILVHNGCEQWDITRELLSTGAGAIAGVAAGLVAEKMASYCTDDPFTIEMTSHASAFAAGGTAGALVGSCLLPGVGTVLGGCAGVIGGVMANRIRMVFYRVTAPDGKVIKDGDNDVYYAYLADRKSWDPNPELGKVENPHWHPELATAFCSVAVKAAQAVGKIVAHQAALEIAENTAKQVGRATAKAVYKETVKESGKQAAKQAGRAAGKVAAKESLEASLKAAPGVGLVAGIGCAAWRLGSSTYQLATGQMGGGMYAAQWGLASCEVGGGVASCFPGPGTAVAVGLDVAVAAADIGTATYQAIADKEDS